MSRDTPERNAGVDTRNAVGYVYPMTTETTTSTETALPVGTRVQHNTTKARGTVTDAWVGYGGVTAARVKWDDKPRRSSVLTKSLTVIA